MSETGAPVYLSWCPQGKSNSQEIIGMSTVKDKIRKLLDELPDNVSYEDVQYHIYARQKIERGLQDEAEGRLVSQEEAERRMARWLAE